MINIRITVEEVISHLQEYNLTLLSEFKNSNTKLKILCENGHTMNVSYHDFKRRKNKGCNLCNNDYVTLWNSRTGNVYRELVLLEHVGDGMCKFKCSCGEIVIKRFTDVERGKTTSCGHNRESQKLEDLTGQTFAYLTAIEFVGYLNNQAHYLFKCVCGKEVVRLIKEVKRGKLKSCGCKMGEGCGAKITHGLSKDRLYGIYKGMMRRCTNPQDSSYYNYGGRGITICDEWLDKEHGVFSFYEWAINNGYSDDLTLDRIDVNGNYEPSNCRWITMAEQQNNKRNTLYHTFNNETKTLTEWARELDLYADSLWKRIYKYNYSFEKAVTYKVHKLSKYKPRNN